ncbi:Alpha/Beta hydrolase protein [Spinellus fusiger]|nr:Alpha/Beta hydrolase protein [Spinellus fusiger]
MGAVKVFHHEKPTTVHLVNEDKKMSLVEYIARECPSIIGPKAVYNPTPYLFHSLLQGAYSVYEGGTKIDFGVNYEREYYTFPDGGQLALDWTNNRPSDFLDKTPTAVFLHGLTGGSNEYYILSMLQVITAAPFNYRGVVINNRGCANSELTTPQLYSGCYTDDVRAAIKHIQKSLAPGTPLIGIGFSLGSNILVKYLGEEGDKTPLTAAVSIGNPFDFKGSSDLLYQSLAGRNIYAPVMATGLKKLFFRHAAILSKLDHIDTDEIMATDNIRDFDKVCTRKLTGHTTVNNYYRAASSCCYIEHVRIPLLCINALDDPISNKACIPYDEIATNPYVILALTEQGGHIGWFEHFFSPKRWIVKPVTEFIGAMGRAFGSEEYPGQFTPTTKVADTVDDINKKL